VAYLGVQPTAGQYRKLDDISGSFNGSTTTFTTQVGGQNVTAGSAQSILVSLGGVIQSPGTNYSVSTNSITFVTAPAAGLSFFAILLGEAVNTGTPSDGTVTPAKLSTGGPSWNSTGNVVLQTAGTTAAPALQTTGDTNTGIYFPAADTIGFVEGGVEVMRIDSSGRVGIGTTSPSRPLHVSSSGSEQVTLTSTSGSLAGIFFEPNGTTYTPFFGATGNSLVSYTQGLERARIDSSGRLLVGTSTTVAANRTLQVAGSGAEFFYNATDTDAVPLILSKSRGSLGSPTIVSSGDSTGFVRFRGYDGSGYVDTARIESAVDGTPGTNDMPGRLVFYTTADGASSPTERMRIRSDGIAFIPAAYGATTASAANVNVAADGALQRSTSSIKYKTDIETLDPQYSEALLDCRPVWYRSTCAADNPGWGWWGFIAEEVAVIDPRLVQWKTVEITHDDKGSVIETPCEPEPEGVAYDRFVPHLLNLIKRQKEQIEAMEARLSALEGA
jgi:hypothetical protein